MIAGGVKENVIPAHCKVLVDCRVPPELDEDHVRARVAAVLSDGDWELEIPECIVGNRSRLESPLADAISSWVSEVDRGARLVPTVMAGFSDSHWFREQFDATVLGFCPSNAMTLAEEAPLVHGADERVAAPDVELAARFFCDLPIRVLG
jgi:acetylornithine deacetylase/succinyl-diaminopimelate desuccinylase-like protein